MLIAPEISGASVVLLGSFNPAIFTPAWFTLHDILPESTAHSAGALVAHGSSFSAESQFHATPDPFPATTQLAPNVRLQEFAVRVATVPAQGDAEAADTGHSPLVTSNSTAGTSAAIFATCPTPPRFAATLHPLQEWEGYVVAIEGDHFVARLVDLTAGDSQANNEAVIPLAEISEHDASRMMPGSIFRWVIGYERSVEEMRRRVSQVVFRDLPRLTEGDLRAGRDWSRSVVSVFDQ